MGPLALLAVATATTTAAPRIELITMGPGPELYSFWGHSAVRVVESDGRDLVYNFGSVDFSGNFFMRMLRGQVDAYVSLGSYRGTVRAYVGEDRTFTRRVLDLEPARARQVARSLRRYVGGKRHEYRYHHFLDNCSTRVADEIDRAVGGVLSENAHASTHASFRTYALDMIRPHPFYYVLIDLLITSASDRPISVWEARFLPSVFVELLDRAEVAGRPVVAARYDLHESKTIPEGETGSWPWLQVYLLFTIPVCLLLWRRPRAGLFVWGTVSGLLGLAILLIWAVTNYDFTARNANVLLVPVTHFAFAVGAFSRRIREKLRVYAIGHALVAIALAAAWAAGLIGQAIGPALVFALPPSLAWAVWSGKKRT